MNELFYPILIPATVGLIVCILPGLNRTARGIIALAGALAACWYAWVVTFGSGPDMAAWGWTEIAGLRLAADLRLDRLAALMLLPALVFTVLMIVYSLGEPDRSGRSRELYAYLLWCAAAGAAVFLADNLLLLLVGWEVVTVLLYLLITMGDEGSTRAASKTFVITGFADGALLLGIMLLWSSTGTVSLSGISGISTASPINTVMFLLFLTGALVKAGAMPGHSWIPEAAAHAPVTVTAFLPACLDKLLGIYLLARISLDLFAIGTGITLLLLVIGAVTIIAAVVMALMQHDLKKLLAFHAVSQVGYMFLGIASGVPAGIAGGLFHMLNNAVYKSCLFLGAGVVEERTGSTDLERLGGMGRIMPLTFGCMLVASLAISGVPPLNGFASKWLIYRGMVEIGAPLFLIAAMFGSALTLASFIKVIYAVFLGRKTPLTPDAPGERTTAVIPMMILAAACMLGGVLAQVPLRWLIGPAAGLASGGMADMLASASAMWSPVLTTVLIVAALVLGALVYLLGQASPRRTTTPFIGGELLDSELSRFPGTGFYETIRLIEPLKTLLRDAQKGVFDLYVMGGVYGGRLVRVLRSVHNGVLSTYVAFALAGLGALLFVLLR